MWLVSFVKWTGIRIFREELKEFTRSGRTLQDQKKGRGLSYINHKKEKKQIVLFVREKSNNEYGTISFVNLGPVEFQSYEGSQPMNITWKLQIPLPSYLWKDSSKTGCWLILELFYGK